MIDDIKNPDEVDSFLAHYGVMGMKWGRRRSDAVLDRAAGRRQERKQIGREISERATLRREKRADRGTALLEKRPGTTRKQAITRSILVGAGKNFAMNIGSSVLSVAISSTIPNPSVAQILNLTQGVAVNGLAIANTVGVVKDIRGINEATRRRSS